MGRKLLWALLAVSLALNLGFAAGVLHLDSEAERLGASAEARFGAVVSRLELDSGQRAALEALRAKVQTRREASWGQRDQRRAALMAELTRPELDQARLEQVMSEGRDQRSAFFRDLMVELHGFLAGLSPAQKEAFLAMAEERGFLRGLFGFGSSQGGAQGESQAQAQN
jgi:uncharacterized membrane protein